jgi:hypothetical protein
VAAQYFHLLQCLGPELHILREAPLEDIARKAGPVVAEGIRRLRAGEVKIDPGYDGEYGRIKIFEQNELRLFSAPTCISPEPVPTAPSSGQASARAESAVPGADGKPSEAYPYGMNREQ